MTVTLSVVLVVVVFVVVGVTVVTKVVVVGVQGSLERNQPIAAFQLKSQDIPLGSGGG